MLWAPRYAPGVSADLTPQEAADQLARGEVQLIDVREPQEWDAGRIAGAQRIGLSELSERASSIDGGRPIVFYCRSGSRSAMATQAFAQAGYDAHNLAGGLIAWRDAGLPLEPKNGRVAAQ